MMGTLLDLLVDRIDSARASTAGSMVAPVALLWPDRNREWELLLPVVAQRVEVLRLGDYRPDAWTGPALWLRCVIAGTIDVDRPRHAGAPVVYLPGVGRDDLRAVEECPDRLKPLAELSASQRATVFGHQNGRDWNVHGWLTNKDRGAGLALASDVATVDALADALEALMEQTVDSARSHPWNAADLRDLLEPDLWAEVLRWLSDEQGYRAAKSPDRWRNFVQMVKQRLGVDPEADGVLVAVEQLAERQKDWAKVWARFADAPTRYPGIEGLLRRATPSLAPRHPDSWPQLNDDAENLLRSDLLALADRPPAEVRAELPRLDTEQGPRRDGIWAAPLAEALGSLVRLGETTASALGGVDAAALADLYADKGWVADDRYLHAAGSVTKATDLEAVRAVAATMYLPWLDASARTLQQYFAAAPVAPKTETYPVGTCLLFVDGLRFDLGGRLAQHLGSEYIEVQLEHRLAALPTTTGTAKPAVMPVAGDLGGGQGFEPAVKEGGQPFSQSATRLMREAGWQWPEADEAGDPSGRAWMQFGDIDTMGHKLPLKLPGAVGQELDLIAERVIDLLDAGWQRVVVVTDHGWLLLPREPEKVDIPKDATEPRSARCARLKPMAAAGGGALTVPWSWDASAAVAYPPGISVFVAGGLFHHGGISPQEVVVPRLTCTRTRGAALPALTVASVKWAGARARVEVSGACAGCRLDLRKKAADAGSTIAATVTEIDADGRGSVLLKEDSLLGESGFVVVLAPDGQVATMMPVMLGGS